MFKSISIWLPRTDQRLRLCHPGRGIQADLALRQLADMQRDNLNVCAVAPAWAIIRSANPRRPDRLLAFVRKAPLPAGPLAGVLVDEWKIIDAAGREFDDSIFCYDEAETNS